MTALQHSMFMKQITSLHTARYGGYTFEIKRLMTDMYRLNQYSNGVVLTLFTGTEKECIDAAEECINMITGN